MACFIGCVSEMGARVVFCIAVLGLGLMLSACAVPRPAQPSATGAAVATERRSVPKPTLRYSAADGVALHRKADASSEIVGELALHEDVLRHRRRAGFAYVTSQRSGLSGWVREQQLIARLPAQEPEPAQEPDLPEPPPPEQSIFDPY